MPVVRLGADSAPRFSTEPGFHISSASLGHSSGPSWPTHAEPSFERGQVLVQHVGAKAIEHELSLTPGLDESRPRQLLEMVRHRRLGDWELLAQPLAADFTAIGDLFEYLKPPWIGERLGNTGEAFVINRHRSYR